MKIGLIADTQGSFDVDALVAFVGRAFAGVDEIWHAGDWGVEAVLDGLRSLGPPLVVVNGNAPDDPRYPLVIDRTIGNWRVVMVHNLQGSLPRLRGRVGEGAAVVIHAHTHRWRDETVGPTRFINPGTATKPQFGGSERTMARLMFGRDLVVEKVLVPKLSFPSPAQRGRAWRGPI
ncbi:MAG TPA: metallophosphoesterase family protein [Candidatus Dormibacteraeota bacterium]